MARGHKKGPKNRQNATGNGRISILTEENDTYNPFKDIKKMDAVKKVDIQSKQKKPNSKSKNEKIIEIDKNASFEDIFNQWENVGTLNSKKKKENVEKEDFASIFNQWEVSQGLKPKYNKKAKDAPDRKKSNYTPKKDFSQILDEYEGTSVLKNKKDQKKNLQQNKSNKKENTKKDTNTSNLEIKQKVNSSYQNKKVKYTPTKDFEDILNEFENKPNNVDKEENITLEQKIKEKKIITPVNKNNKINNNGLDQKVKFKSENKITNQNSKKDFGGILNEFENKSIEKQVEIKQKIEKKVYPTSELKINEKTEVKDSPKEKLNIKDKVESSKKVSLRKDFGKILDDYEKKTFDETIKKDNSKKAETSSNEKEELKHNKSEKDNNWKSHSNRNNDKKENYYKANREKRDHKTKESNIDPKWDFSNIYGVWESKNNEEKLIEEKKNTEKKENKGISISYLRSMSPQDELDLHGYTSDIATLKVSEFLRDSRDKGYKKVSIITGKGNHSENGKSVIKELVLDEIKYSNIVREAYHPKAVHGGSGAIWVIFKSKSEKKIYF